MAKYVRHNFAFELLQIRDNDGNTPVHNTARNDLLSLIFESRLLLSAEIITILSIKNSADDTPQTNSLHPARWDDESNACMVERFRGIAERADAAMFEDRDTSLDARISWDRKLRLRCVMAQAEEDSSICDFLAACDSHDLRTEELDRTGNRALHYADTVNKINAVLSGVDNPNTILSLLALQNKSGETARQFLTNSANATKKKFAKFNKFKNHFLIIYIIWIITFFLF